MDPVGHDHGSQCVFGANAALKLSLPRRKLFSEGRSCGASRDASEALAPAGFDLGEAALSLVSGGLCSSSSRAWPGPELLGTYAVALAWLMLFQGVSSFGIPEFLIREVGAHGRDAAGHVVHSMLLGLGSGLVGGGPMLAAVRSVGIHSISRSGHHHRQPGVDPGLSQYRLPFGVPGPAPDASDIRCVCWSRLRS